VHRDLKPSNVMLARRADGKLVPRIIDFGIAKVFEPGEGTTSGNTLTGTQRRFTPAYAAPEQLAGVRTGPWTDVHAIALLFCEIVTGKMPYGAGKNVLGAIDPERPTPKRLGVDVGAFEEVLARAMALRPTDRHRDAGELLKALRRAARTMGIATPSG